MTTARVVPTGDDVAAPLLDVEQGKDEKPVALKIDSAESTTQERSSSNSNSNGSEATGGEGKFFDNAGSTRKGAPAPAGKKLNRFLAVGLGSKEDAPEEAAPTQRAKPQRRKLQRNSTIMGSFREAKGALWSKIYGNKDATGPKKRRPSLLNPQELLDAGSNKFKFVVNPNIWEKVAWAWVVIFLVCWNMFYIPYNIAFLPDESVAILAIDIVVNVLLWIDIVLSFRTGVVPYNPCFFCSRSFPPPLKVHISPVYLLHRLPGSHGLLSNRS